MIVVQLKSMKEFINDCLLFKSKDREIKIIAIFMWIFLIGILIFSLLEFFTQNKNPGTRPILRVFFL